jgi:hypothetical protein
MTIPAQFTAAATKANITTPLDALMEMLLLSSMMEKLSSAGLRWQILQLGDSTHPQQECLLHPRQELAKPKKETNSPLRMIIAQQLELVWVFHWAF